jgi:hypothetical protein
MHHATREVQLLEIVNTMEHETFRISVKNPMGGKFKIMFENPKYNGHNKQAITTRTVKDNDRADAIRNALHNFYNTIWGTNVQVTKHALDSDGNVADSTEEVVEIVYDVKVINALPDYSFEHALIIPEEGTTSEIVISPPLTKSSPPLGGNFVIECKDSRGYPHQTRELRMGAYEKELTWALQQDIPHLAFKASLQSTGKYAPRDNRLEYMLVFHDVLEDPEECLIKSGTESPLTGNLEIKTTTVRPYGQNLMFEPVPLEMMYHDAQKPQVMVKVNNIEGLCPEFNCDYLYTQATSEITAQSLTNGKEVTIEGT